MAGVGSNLCSVDHGGVRTEWYGADDVPDGNVRGAHAVATTADQSAGGPDVHLSVQRPVSPAGTIRQRAVLQLGVQQSGFDPANPQVYTPPPPPQSAPQGGVLRGAAGGAALGAIGGAIGGDAGKGAAIGAGAGALFGLMRRARWEEEEQQQQQSYMAQQQNALAQGHAAYNRAFATCMTGRGYTVST